MDKLRILRNYKLPTAVESIVDDVKNFIYDVQKDYASISNVVNWLLDKDSTITSGTYTPVAGNAVNLDTAPGIYVAQYLKVGNIVTVSGKFNVDPTAAGATSFTMTLPVASNFASEQQCGGSAFAIGVAGQGAGIYADATNNVAKVEWVAVDTAVRAMFFTFTYRII